MLILRRCIDQAVVVGDTTYITVQAFVGDNIILNIKTSSSEKNYSLKKGETLALSDVSCVIILSSLDIFLGRANLGFKAPQHIEINRYEVWVKKTSKI